MNILETKRTYVRRFEENDIDMLHEMLSDSEVMRYYPNTCTYEQSKEWMERIFKDYDEHDTGWFAVFHKDSHELIGQMGIHFRNVNGEDVHMLSYMTNKKFWRQGYTYEVSKALMDMYFKEKVFEPMHCVIRPINIPSVMLIDKLGFNYIGNVNYGGYDHKLYKYNRWS